MKQFVILPILLVYVSFLTAQTVLETKNWCVLDCEISKEDLSNIELIHLKLKNDSIKIASLSENMLRFPLRIGVVQKDTTKIGIKEIVVRKAIDDLNKSFKPVGFSFYLESVDIIVSGYSVEELSRNAFNLYDDFSAAYDKENTISVYILDHEDDFCVDNEGAISCRKIGGFSYIFSNRANNIVLSRFDLEDQKIVAHEFGHFFGLYHTFEENVFGKDNFDESQCHLLGDRICDTPPDPGAAFETHINYSACKMVGWKDENGNEYHPMIENFMSYYRPCYLKEFKFTEGQIKVMRLAGLSDIRKRFSR